MDFIAHGHLMASHADVHSIKCSTAEKSPCIKRDKRNIEALVSKITGPSLWLPVAHEVGIRLKLEVLKNLDLRSESEPAELIKGLGVIYPVDSIDVSRCELHLSAPEKLDGLNQHGVIIGINRRSKIFGKKAAPISSIRPVRREGWESGGSKGRKN